MSGKGLEGNNFKVSLIDYHYLARDLAFLQEKDLVSFSSACVDHLASLAAVR